MAWPLLHTSRRMPCNGSLLLYIVPLACVSWGTPESNYTAKSYIYISTVLSDEGVPRLHQSPRRINALVCAIPCVVNISVYAGCKMAGHSQDISTFRIFFAKRISSHACRAFNGWKAHLLAVKHLFNEAWPIIVRI